MASKKGLIPLTSEEWNQLNPKAKWDIQAALRGPDTVHSEGIKWITTAVIRGKMREVMRVGGMINQDLNLIVLPSNLSISEDERKASASINPIRFWDYNHFISHVNEAAAWLAIPTVQIDGLWELLHRAGTSHGRIVNGLIELLAPHVKMMEDKTDPFARGYSSRYVAAREELQRHYDANWGLIDKKVKGLGAYTSSQG